MAYGNPRGVRDDNTAECWGLAASFSDALTPPEGEYTLRASNQITDVIASEAKQSSPSGIASSSR